MADAPDDAPFDPHDKLLELHAEYEREATPSDRAFARATGVLALPGATLIIAGLAALWTVANTLAPRLGVHPLDPPPFEGLQAFGTVAAIIIATMILAGQRRENEAARRRGQLTLHLAAESEHKIAKLISLLEEQRRHNPMLPDRHDPEADRMAQPAEPRDVLQRMGSAPAGDAALPEA